jgi:hypothetical protein
LRLQFICSNNPSICRKPSSGEPSKKVAVASHPPPTGAIVSSVPAVTDALQHCRQAAAILENLKDQEIDQKGNPLFLLTCFFF